MSSTASVVGAQASGTFLLGGDLPVTRLGFGAMRVTGPGISGDPKDPGRGKVRAEARGRPRNQFHRYC